MTRRQIALVAAALILGLSAGPDALGQQATIEGVARADQGGAPVQFALVRLLRADSSPSPSDSPPQGMTNANGRFRFDGVAPGRYRVQLLRIGLLPVLSEPVQVSAGETRRLDLRVASPPLVLPAITVTVTADVCVTAKELSQHPRLHTLWQQARDGASVRSISAISATPGGQSGTPRATGRKRSLAATTPRTTDGACRTNWTSCMRTS
jgi:hypothetical protein